VDESGKPLANAMILPFGEATHRPGVISWGCSSYGYDVRVGNRFKVLRNEFADHVIDPKGVEDRFFCSFISNHCIIPPNSFALAETVEHFEIPRNVLAVCLGKSTYARCGIIINVTPLEPEWRGKITLEISNTTPLPAMIYANEGIAQIIFHANSYGCERSYADKKGKYQDQAGLTLPIVK
jgi:dCTP deaminase